MGRRVRFVDYDVDFARRELRKGGTRLALQPKPFRVLELLLRNPGELVTREELVTYLWPDSHVSFEHGLNTAVNSLRQVLGESSRECHFIETRPGLGYRFTAAVQEMTEAKNPDAYGDFLKGRYFLDKVVEEEIHKAIAYFNSAALDETCRALAHAGLADAYCQLALVSSVSPMEALCRARSSAEYSLRSQPDLPEAHVADARVKMVFDWDWKGAQAAVDRALELDSKLVTAHTLKGALFCTLGNQEEALLACRRAIALDQLSFPVNLQLAACLYAAGHYKDAVDQCWKILTLTHSFAPAQVLLALAYEQLGMHEEAIVEFQNARHCSGLRAAVTSGLAHVYFAAGQHSEADEAADELAKQAGHGYVACYWQAVVCAGSRQDTQALSFLEESLHKREPALLWLKADARFDALRNDARFPDVLRQEDCAVTSAVVGS